MQLLLWAYQNLAMTDNPLIKQVWLHFGARSDFGKCQLNGFSTISAVKLNGMQRIGMHGISVDFAAFLLILKIRTMNKFVLAQLPEKIAV